MSFTAFLGFLAAGAALLAGWFVTRFPDRSPRAGRRAGLHLGLALVLVWATPNLVETFAAGMGRQAVLGVFLLVLPALVYACLAAVWVLTRFHEAIGR